jgi:hypothetical protein
MGNKVHLQVTIEVDHTDRSILSCDTTKQWESNSMIASQGDYPRKGFSVLRGTFNVGIRGWLSGQDAVMTVFNLLDCVCIIVPAKGSRQTQNHDKAIKAVNGGLTTSPEYLRSQ